ncbi:type I methionyl aminopeptidase [Ectobacillus polymachus]|uniref:type I methionyl aminopeptidase n=1 Tax=Ectobacillus polymachus TaxID=1508806 RepID=UPI003A8565C8
MITLKTEREITLMHEAGKLLAACHQKLADLIQPGITTKEIDAFVDKFLAQNGAKPEQKGYRGYEYATCASINDEICHGFPRKSPLKEGDIVTVDMVVNLHGGLADSAWSYGVGKISKHASDLLAVTKEALYLGINQAKAGNRIGDIGHAIQSFVEPKGYSVVREFTGHGIGHTIHEDPYIPHYGLPGKGHRLKPGMVITIEPMINIGAWQSKMDSNKWTARTIDGSLSAQYEHTLVITDGDPIILTEQN